MHRTTTSLLLTAAPAVVAGLLVLAICNVGRGVWLVQGVAIVMMIGLAFGLARMPRALASSRFVIMAGLGLALCAWPLVGVVDGPARWLRLGGLSLYVAPVVAPAMLAAAARAHRRGRRAETVAISMLAGLALVLAAQPDLAQVLAVAVPAAVIAGRARQGWLPRLFVFAALAAAAGLAAWRDVPLAPVDHVERVFRVAWAWRIPAGLGVAAAALLFTFGLAARLARIDRSLAVVASYYVALFVLSLADLTPAPLIGFGAGHLLGFGVLLGSVGTCAGASDRAPRNII